MNNIQTLGASAYNSIPSIRLSTPSEIVQKVIKIALPALVFVAAINARKVSATPFTDCVLNCDKHKDAHPLAKLICYGLCAIFCKN